MAEDRKRTGPSRRAFLKAGAVGGAAAIGIETAREARAEPSLHDHPAPASSVARGAIAAADVNFTASTPDSAPLFSHEERGALASLADVVLPGAGAWGAVDFIEKLLTAFDHDPPHIYAGTAGSTDDWLPLDRVRMHAWRLRIFGSEAVDHAGASVMGPVRGLRPLLLEGAREAAAELARGSSADRVWSQMPSEFKDELLRLVLEATFADPVYGGNREGAAWRSFHFEGAMLGYGTYFGATHASSLESSATDEGPSPLTWTTRTMLWVMGFFSRRIA